MGGVSDAFVPDQPLGTAELLRLIGGTQADYGCGIGIYQTTSWWLQELDDRTKHSEGQFPVGAAGTSSAAAATALTKISGSPYPRLLRLHRGPGDDYGFSLTASYVVGRSSTDFQCSRDLVRRGTYNGASATPSWRASHRREPSGAPHRELGTTVDAASSGLPQARW
jgi:hypothetical protein